MITKNLEKSEQQDFFWSFIEFDEKRMHLNIEFNNPEVVSFDKTDIIQIMFMNTQFYLVPKSPELLSTPNGFKVDVKMPPQRPRDKIGATDIDENI